jgi:hypothetical protein
MLIDFIQIQKQKFEALALDIIAEPERYLDFDSVSDFYKVQWLNDFPQGTTWIVSGLDNGAEEFCIQIEYKDHFLFIEVQHPRKIQYGIRQDIEY